MPSDTRLPAVRGPTTPPFVADSVPCARYCHPCCSRGSRVQRLHRRHDAMMHILCFPLSLHDVPSAPFWGSGDYQHHSLSGLFASPMLLGVAWVVADSLFLGASQTRNPIELASGDASARAAPQRLRPRHSRCARIARKTYARRDGMRVWMRREGWLIVKPEGGELVVPR
jgi:hypothetical protein